MGPSPPCRRDMTRTRHGADAVADFAKADAHHDASDGSRSIYLPRRRAARAATYLDGEPWSANVETLDSGDNRYSSTTTREVFQLPGGQTVALGRVARDRIIGSSMLARVEEYVDAIELVYLRCSVHAF